MKPRESHRVRKGSGFVLVGVLIVVMLLSMIALSVLFRMRSEETAGATGSTSEQGWATAMSGVREAMRLAPTFQPGDTTWMDAPERFKDRMLYDDGTEEWRWTLYSANPEGGIRFGLTDEASKLNLNSATTSMVSRLPGMKVSLTDALLDFLDADDVPRPEGAEQEYYNALPQPYRMHNGPLSTVEQLLLVRGFSPSVVLGEDANRNFSLDPNEDDGDEREPPDDADGRLQPGLLPLLTVYSREPNTDRSGKRRFNLNTPGAALTETNDLPSAFVAFVSELGTSKSVVMDPAELLDATVTLSGPDGQERAVPTGIGKDSLGMVLDRFTGSAEAELVGRINVNTAPASVLQLVPGIDNALAESILSARRNLPAERRNSVAWIHVENLVEAEKFREIAPFLTVRSLQFRFNVVGYGARSGRFRVLEAVIDATSQPVRLVYLRDLTRLGLPFPIALESDEGGPSAESGSTSRSGAKPSNLPQP
ncbi:MAG: general secretion pathway protein GspK [Limisphaerales bacterium]|jgi:type II secretory pathway component PulK